MLKSAATNRSTKQQLEFLQCSTAILSSSHIVCRDPFLFDFGAKYRIFKKYVPKIFYCSVLESNFCNFPTLIWKN